MPMPFPPSIIGRTSLPAIVVVFSLNKIIMILILLNFE
jgi:hypothetical protein